MRANYSTPGTTTQQPGDRVFQLSAPLQQQTLQILAFRELKPHWMVRRRAEALQEEQRGMCVRGRPGHDLLEQVGRYPPRAGESRQKPSGPQQPERIQVHV